ncbi:ATP-dependent DNA ligase LigA [Halorarius halobius]|uniref:ATP-dependent DNA ligase LigA n=1 Tax=Halorarius halobius TaxID=2962671 RepID=UPI0020CD2913|nr:ATP-dependent DNA ligase LigA [Halorarius halobius]
MEFARLADRADAIEAESADLETVALVADLLAEAGEGLPVVARFLQGQVFPAHDSTKLDVGPALVHETIARAAGHNVTADDVEDRLADVGEIGAVAASYEFGGQTGLGAFTRGGDDALTVGEVDEELRALAAAEGTGSEDTKRDALFGLFNRCSPSEAKLLARLVLGEMRIGVGGGTVRDAVAEAFDVPLESVERALQVSNDYGLVAVRARDDGEAGLNAIDLQLGRPVQAMLAQAGTATEALEAFGEVVVETKYDGARVQVHHGDETRVFSRNMEEVTEALPEIVEFVDARLDAPTILDGEVVAVDDAGDPLPFQEVLTRFRRKHDVERMRESVAVELRAFDCLHADGEDLLDASLSERHDRLRDLLDEGVSTLAVADDADAIAAHEERALEAGHEGIMLKNPESAYTPGRRGKNWLKRKPDVETLDCVVVGAEWGEGRRAELFGTFRIAVTDGDGYATVGKVATGVTDDQLAELTERLEPYVRTSSGQDVTFVPEVVFEVGYEEIQSSTTYGSGYALRFPRFVAVREDASPEDADSLNRVRRLADR